MANGLFKASFNKRLYFGCWWESVCSLQHLPLIPICACCQRQEGWRANGYILVKAESLATCKVLQPISQNKAKDGKAAAAWPGCRKLKPRPKGSPPLLACPQEKRCILGNICKRLLIDLLFATFWYILRNSKQNQPTGEENQIPHSKTKWK